MGSQMHDQAQRELDRAVQREAGANRAQVGGDHYKTPIEHWDYVLANDIPYLEAQIIKYVTRHRRKNGVEDLRKAEHFLQKLLEVETSGMPRPPETDGWTCNPCTPVLKPTTAARVQSGPPPTQDAPKRDDDPPHPGLRPCSHCDFNTDAPPEYRVPDPCETKAAMERAADHYAAHADAEQRAEPMDSTVLPGSEHWDGESRKPGDCLPPVTLTDEERRLQKMIELQEMDQTMRQYMVTTLQHMMSAHVDRLEKLMDNCWSRMMETLGK